MMDIDKCKSYSDTYAHAVGDLSLWNGVARSAGARLLLAAHASRVDKNIAGVDKTERPLSIMPAKMRIQIFVENAFAGKAEPIQNNGLLRQFPRL